MCWAAASHCTNCSGANLNSPFDELLPLLPKQTYMRCNEMKSALICICQRAFSHSWSAQFLSCYVMLIELDTSPSEKLADCLEGIFLLAGVPGSHPLGRAVYAGGGTSASRRCWSPAAAMLDTEADQQTSPNSASVLSCTGDRQRRAADVRRGLVRASRAVCSVSPNICQPSLKNPLEISQLGRNDDDHHKWKMKTLSRRLDLPYATSELFFLGFNFQLTFSICWIGEGFFDWNYVSTGCVYAEALRVDFSRKQQLRRDILNFYI